jgi:tetratricopeptide (TPR) repeat protein
VSALHERYAKDLRRIARVLCYHHHAVGAWSEALTWGLAAAEDDLALHANDAADASLVRALDAADRLRDGDEPPPTADLARLDALRGALYVRLGRYADAGELLVRAIGRLEGRGPMRVDALLDLAQCNLGRGEMERALATARDAVKLAIEAADGTRALAASVQTASYLTRLGRLTEAEETLRAALDGAPTDPGLVTRSQALRELSWIATKRGAFSVAEARGREALELARAASDPMAQHAALSALAAAYDEGGDPAAALPFEKEALAIARALSLRRREGIDLANMGEAHLSLGHVALAEQHFREALAIFQEIGDRACEGDCRVNVGRALLARGNRAAAIAMLDRGRKLCESTGRAEYAGLALVTLGEAHRGLGDLAKAGAAFEDAHRLFAQQGSHYLWRASVGLARVALAQGRRDEALSRAEEGRGRLLAQRSTLAPGSSSEALDRSLAEIAQLLEQITTPAPGPG